MFSLSEFIKQNLIAGVKNGSFTRERVNILAVDYMLKGVLVMADLEDINNATAVPPEPEIVPDEVD